MLALEQGHTLKRRSKYGECVEVVCSEELLVFLVDGIGYKFRPHYLLLDDYEIGSDVLDICVGNIEGKET